MIETKNIFFLFIFFIYFPAFPFDYKYIIINLIKNKHFGEKNEKQWNIWTIWNRIPKRRLLWKESFNGKYGWVLVKQTVKLKRPLLVGEELIVSTRAKGERKIQYFRTYDLKINDEVVGGIYSIWTLIDIEKRRIVRPQKVGITIPECEEYSSFVEKYEPLLDIETQKVQTREVMYSDIDLNKHMNNARYLEWVMDLLPQNVLEKYFIGEMTMHYQKEIAPESIVDLYYGQEDDHFKIEFKIAEQIHFVISGRFKEKKE